MNFDTSGPTVVLDAKSKAGVEAIQNKVTMLESEAIRLGKLKATLEGDVRKSEAQLSYLAENEKELSNRITLLKTTATELNAEVVASVEERDSIRKKMSDEVSDLKTRREDVELRENALVVRESALAENERKAFDAQKLAEAERTRVRKALADSKKILENI